MFIPSADHKGERAVRGKVLREQLSGTFLFLRAANIMALSAPCMVLVPLLSVLFDLIYFHFIDNVTGHSEGKSLVQVLLLISSEIKI